MRLPLLQSADPQRPLLWWGGRQIPVRDFMCAAGALARALPQGRYLVNLCEGRHEFLIAYCAALLRGQTNLLPAARAPQAVAEVMALYPGSYGCDDGMVGAAMRAAVTAAGGDTPARDALIPGEQLAEIAFTSGSTGAPTPHQKRWRHFLHSTERTAARIRACLAPRHGDARPWLVATVPPQHMYGTETSLLLPLAADMALHCGRPLFPADVAAALAAVPQPRVLVTTPVHLRALVASGQDFPDIGVVVCATAPLDVALATAAERQLRTTVMEMFGSTETCAIASRCTAREAAWRLYPDIALQPQTNGARVDAPWFDAPAALQDNLDIVAPGHFVVRGRNADMVDVAGKRASLEDLTRRLLDIAGVEDAVVFQPDGPQTGVVQRLAALVVAPGLSAEAICAQLGRSVDSVFIPRPLLLVPALPRDELGKLPRERLLAALR